MTYDVGFAVGDLVLMPEYRRGKAAYLYPCVYEVARIEIERGRGDEAVVRCRLRRPGSGEDPDDCVWAYADNLTPATEESIGKACEDHAAALLGELARRRG